MFSRWWILVVTACRSKNSSSYEQIKKKTGDSVLVQSKGTETLYFNSIRIIIKYALHIVTLYLFYMQCIDTRSCITQLV